MSGNSTDIGITGAGTTGAWVVRGEVLYGVIIAVYENEPFALMMTVERLFASILGSAFSIRSVELWDGEVPEALLQKVQREEEKVSKQVKDGIPASPRRRTYTETQDTNGGASSSKQNGTANGGRGSSSRPRHKSEGTQTLPPLPRTAEGGTQTEEPHLPDTNAVVEAGRPVSKSIQTPSSPGQASGRKETRSQSVASDVSMSGAVHENRQQPTSEAKQRSGTSDSAVSAGAHTTYSTTSVALERQDSGFEPAAPPAQTPTNNPNEATDETPRRGLQAPPILPADKSRRMSLRGGVSPNESRPGTLDAAADEDRERTPTRPPSQSRTSSFQKVLGKTFRRSSSKGPSRDDSDDNHGIPPTGLDGRRPLFNRRRSSAVDPKRASSRQRASSNAPSGSDERPSSSIRTGTAKLQKAEHSTKDENFGIPPGGLNDRRPLSFIRRISAKGAESVKSARDTDDGEAGGGGGGGGASGSASGSGNANRPSGSSERPLSFLRRAKGKAPEETKEFHKENNYGIPPTGL